MSDNIISSTPTVNRTQSPTTRPPSRQEQQQPHHHHTQQKNPHQIRRTIICDAYYGWPHQKRPRSERIRAVAQQIHNFYRLATTTTPSSSPCSEKKYDYDGGNAGANELLVIGHETDLRPLYSRLEVLNNGHGMCWGDDEDDDDGDKSDRLIHFNRYGDEGMTLLNIVFLPGWTIKDCYLRHNGKRRGIRGQEKEGDTSTNSNNTMATTISLEKGTNDHLVDDDDNNNGNSDIDENVHERRQNDDINDITQQLDNISIPVFSSSSSSSHHDDHPIYLSPDAPSTLNPTLPPPTLIILGMLVDRRVTPGRSQSRAKDINVPSAKLPMSLLSLDNLRDEEPLNIDTVLDIMNGWWKLQRQQRGECGEEETERNVGNFLEAARMAMMRHEERHPGRTLHKTS